jgi:hypothetical protein
MRNLLLTKRLTRTLEAMMAAMAITLAFAASGCVGNDSPIKQARNSVTLSADTPPIASDKELMITHASVVLDSRASSASDGHWSFRWLMEQMTPDGVTPADFVASWLNSLHTTSVNGFAVDDRTGVDTLLSAWPRTSDGKLDLAQAPFRLLAIVNRLDITLADSPGEGRFVFGLVDPKTGNGRALSVIFEYRLAPLGTCDDRRTWAARWHALGSLPFGADYNEALQDVTDGFAARGADSSRPAGSSLGQLRLNEGELEGFGQAWELREFNLVTDASGTFLRLTTTKQNPDQSLNGSTQLAQFIVDNAADIRNGVAVFPAAMLGGQSPANGTNTTWRFPNQPAIDEPLRHAFAVQTCNGCHDAETEQSDFFFHVTPLGGPIASGSDGQNRLSDFLRLTDMPNRVANMVGLLRPAEVPAPTANVRRATVH